MATDDEWAALAEKLTDSAVELPGDSATHVGAAAAAHGRAMLLREYGSEDALDAALRQAGRTRLGEVSKGPSPTVRGRLPEADFAALKRLEASTGKNQSELVREAVVLLLTRHGMRDAS